MGKNVFLRFTKFTTIPPQVCSCYRQSNYLPVNELYIYLRKDYSIEGIGNENFLGVDVKEIFQGRGGFR